jgi:flagellar protein FlaJ
MAIIDESRIITRDVELLGLDIVTALERASKRTKSERFKELLEGFKATIHSGGDLLSFLMDKSRESMRLKRLALRKFSDNLGVISEFYVTLLVAGPLIFVVLLSVMAMLGGAGGGVLNPILLLTLLTYIGIPVGSVIFIIILDALLPK